MQDLHHQLQQARETFGRFLRNWRKANGWVITTPQDWARACPDLIPPGFRVSSGQWANLENAQIKQAQPSTFLQLAVLNQALARSDRGKIADRQLRDRVAGGQPVRKDDGTPWDAEDWFACYIGNLEGPPELWPQPQEDADPSERTRQLRQRFLQDVEQHGLRPITAMVQLLATDPDLDTHRQMALEGALLQEESLAVEDLPTAENLLQRWEQRLVAPKAAAGRGRR